MSPIIRLVIASALFILTIVLLEKAVGKAAYEGFDVSPIVSILVLAIAAIGASIGGLWPWLRNKKQHWSRTVPAVVAALAFFVCLGLALLIQF